LDTGNVVTYQVPEGKEIHSKRQASGKFFLKKGEAQRAWCVFIQGGTEKKKKGEGNIDIRGGSTKPFAYEGKEKKVFEGKDGLGESRSGRVR